MLRGRLRLSDATIAVIGIRKADLRKLLEGRPYYSQVSDQIPAGPVVILSADSHEEIEQTLKTAGVKVPLLVDYPDLQNDGNVRPDLN